MIYFVQAVNPKEKDKSPIKIGVTADPDLRSRMRDLQVGNPYPLKVLGVIAAGNTRLEEYIHEVFAVYRMCGEWFSYSEALDKFITQYTAGYAWGRAGEKIKLSKKMKALLAPAKVMPPVYINSVPPTPPRWVEHEGKLVRRDKLTQKTV